MQDFIFSDQGIAYRTNHAETSRPTVVFIHGLSGSLSAWLPYEHLFQNEYNLVTLDLRGHGLSRKYARYTDYSVERSAKDVTHLLEHLGVRSCILVAHSYGALIAHQIVLSKPHLVTKLVLVGPTVFLSESLWRSIMGSVVRAVAFAYTLLPYFPTKGGRTHYERFAYTADWDPRRIIPDLYHTGLRAYFFCLAQTFKGSKNTTWSSITLPTRILHGTRDTYVPLRNSARLAGEIKGATLITLKGANHIAVLNNVGEIAHEIRSFV